MDKNDTIVTDVVIHALKMDDTIKRQEIMIERLRADKNELLIIISRMKELLMKCSPDIAEQLGLLGI